MELGALVEASNAPVLLAQVVCSDYADVRFAGPGHEINRFVLHPHSAKGYDVDVDPIEQEAAVAALLRWAGTSVREADVSAAVDGAMVFAEDSFMRLAGALGAFPLAELESYIFGPVPITIWLEHGSDGNS